ncbi:MAG: hypothetical protein QGH39_11735 [Candidatus Thermoplasmatota archaeon]|jgi:Flp pilus assembly protein TadB|nr:hypothetical protein [Candidatus Thermoplasmatota archaeon]MDP7266216.1 hypothetical protein [Candidatus Thermoplasmatota archaeon]
MPDFEKDLDYPSSRFTRICKLVNSALYPDLEIKAGADEKERKKRHRRQKELFLNAKQRFENVQKKQSANSHAYRREEKRFLNAEKLYGREDEGFREAKFKKILSLGRLDLEPYEVRSFSNTVLMVLMIIFIVVSAGVIMITDFDIFYIVPCAIATFMIPGLLSFYIDRYPYMRARRMRALTVGRMPEAIHYLSLSMRLTPSLDRAVKYAASSLPEPLSSDLRKVLWDVYMREYSSVEESFIAFAYDWSDWDEDFKRSLYMVRSAALERNTEGINRVLDKANQIIIDGTKGKLEEFSNSLKIPTMILFAVGIMLPLLLAILLPILGIGNEWTWLTVIVINLVLPVGILAYAYSILGNRPELTTPPDIGKVISPAKRGFIIFICFLACGALVTLGVILLDKSIFASLLFVWAVGLPISIYGYFTNREAKGKARAVRRMEDEYPEALFQLGNRIAEGKPLETALEKTAITMKNTLISKLFGKISYKLQVTRSSLKKVLYGPEGLLARSPARTVKNTMHTVVEASSKDPKTAGKTIMLISNYLSELKKVEKELRGRLEEVTGMMTQTAIFIAPLVMGVTVILYQLLAVNLQTYDIPEEMNVELFGFGQDTISPTVLAVSIGIYLIQLMLVVGYFVSRIDFGKDMIELKNNISIFLLIGLTCYSLAMMVTYFIGGAYVTNFTIL